MYEAQRHRGAAVSYIFYVPDFHEIILRTLLFLMFLAIDAVIELLRIPRGTNYADYNSKFPANCCRLTGFFYVYIYSV